MASVCANRALAQKVAEAIQLRLVKSAQWEETCPAAGAIWRIPVKTGESLSKMSSCESEVVSELKIKVARIEMVAPNTKGDYIRVTFQVERGLLVFQVPILLKKKDFDDTEMVQVARNELYRTFVDLAAQTEKWTLTAEDIRQLSSISSRPG